jgi:hypothetical protein
MREVVRWKNEGSLREMKCEKWDLSLGLFGGIFKVRVEGEMKWNVEKWGKWNVKEDRFLINVREMWRKKCKILASELIDSNFKI